jgi:hypothetical protein
LVFPGVFPGKFDLDIDSSAIGNAMTPYISLAVVADVHDRAVLGVELPDRVVSSDAAVLTKSHDNLVL